MTGFQDLEEDKLFLSLREYARVNAYLPVRIRPVPEEEAQVVRSRIVVESALTEHPELPVIEDDALSTCLQILNSKLDSIIRMLAFPSDRPKELDFSKVNISAGGLSTSSTCAYAQDELVELRLMLPTAPSMIFYIYGKVIQCEASNQRYEISIEFTEIDDDIREQIAKYVFHKQREILRRKRSCTA